jgi:hypothetical protein
LRSRKLRLPKIALVPALSAALLVFGVAADAKALPLLTLSGSVRGLYGSPSGDPDRNPYAAGLGLRLGVTLPVSIYLGGSFDYFFGESENAGLDTEISNSILQLMARAGYDIGVGPVTLRPELGFGLSSAKTSVGDVDNSESKYALAPGAEVAFSLGLLSLSAEASYDVVLAGNANSSPNALVLGVGLGFSL